MERRSKSYKSLQAALRVILTQSSDGNLAGDKLHHGFEVFTSSGKTTFVWRRKCISEVQASQVAPTKLRR